MRQRGENKMVKTFEQLNREFMEKQNLIPPVDIRSDTGQRTTETVRRVTNIALYAAIVFILVIAVIFNGHSNKRFSLFGYSGFTVLSESMQSEIPEGALVLVKKGNPDNINVGDDITFIRKKDDSVVTHRVVHIYKSYGEDGVKGFQTQGIENSAPDQDIIYAGDIIGVVKLTIPGLGWILSSIAINIGLLILICGGLHIAIITTKKFVLRNSD
jgi:signal peptidase